MAEADNRAAKTAKFVTVACKHPHGIVLQLQREVPGYDPGTGREIKQWEKHGETHTLRGFAFSRGPDFKPENMPAMSGGYALTPGIPADFWEMWLEQNKNTDIVKNGLVFAAAEQQYASDKARERGVNVAKGEGVSGLEPLDPTGDYRSRGLGISRAEKVA